MHCISPYYQCLSAFTWDHLVQCKYPDKIEEPMTIDNLNEHCLYLTWTHCIHLEKKFRAQVRLIALKQQQGTLDSKSASKEFRVISFRKPFHCPEEFESYKYEYFCSIYRKYYNTVIVIIKNQYNKFNKKNKIQDLL